MGLGSVLNNSLTVLSDMAKLELQNVGATHVEIFSGRYGSSARSNGNASWSINSRSLGKGSSLMPRACSPSRNSGMYCRNQPCSNSFSHPKNLNSLQTMPKYISMTKL